MFLTAPKQAKTGTLGISGNDLQEDIAGDLEEIRSLQPHLEMSEINVQQSLTC